MESSMLEIISSFENLTLDLFCGCGGMSKGLSDAEFNIYTG